MYDWVPNTFGSDAFIYARYKDNDQRLLLQMKRNCEILFGGIIKKHDHIQIFIQNYYEMT